MALYLHSMLKRFIFVSWLLMATNGFAQAQTSPEVVKGLQWLGSQVQANGELQNESLSIATKLQNRSEVAQTLQLLAPPSPQQLLDGLIVGNVGETEYLSRKILNYSFAGKPVTNEVNQLVSRQGHDGGFGAALGYESHSLDTSWALLALKTSNPAANDSVISAAVEFLRTTQQANGAFGLANNTSQYLTTSAAMIALQSVARTPIVLDVLNKASAFLLSQQAADGGWGSVAQTSSVYLALLGSLSDQGLQTRVTGYLLSQQSPNGSWGGDPYVTALALRALTAQPRPVPTTGDITAQIVDASNGQALANANVLLQGASTSMTLASNTQGRVDFKSVLAGAYTMTVNAIGYAGQSRTLNLQAGTTVDLGVLSLQPAPTTGIMQGVVKESATGAVMPGVLISVTGAATANATTLSDGSYSIVGLAPGAVTVSASKNGYVSSGGTGAIVAGAILTFSPALQVTQVSSTTGSIVGLVKDGTTTTPLAGVQITVTGAASGSALTSINGTYNLTGLTPGAVSVTASLNGYTSVSGSGLVSAGGVLTFSPSIFSLGQPPATTSGIAGQVKDSVTGLPIDGVTINVTGSVTATTNTSSDGSYSLNGLTPGPVVITASKTGYASVSGAGTLVAGSLVLFSPSLQNTAGTISGQVVDAVTNAPLAGVTLSVGVGNITTTTANDGRFSVSGIAAGAYSLSFTRLGYTTKSIAAVLVTAGATADLQIVTLIKAASAVSIFGKVSDSVTSQPIVGASVTVLGVNANATTDSTGSYRIEGLTIGSATLRFSAVGYASSAVVRSFDSLGAFQVDAALSAGQGSSVSISKLTSDQAQYAAYAQTALLIEVANSGGQSTDGTVGVTILDDQGKVLDSLEATWTDANGVIQRGFNFPLGITAISVPWNTKANAPGVYSIVAKIYQGVSSPSAGASVELSAKRTDFAILPTQAILSATLTPLPGFTNLGATERIGFKLDIVNRSNVPVTTTLAYQVSSPAQVLVYGSSVNISLEPQEDVKSLMLADFEYQFMESGLYTSSISVTNGVAPALLEAKPISVAPGTRIDPTYSVTPNLVTPDGDKRVRINIKLQGVEQK